MLFMKDSDLIQWKLQQHQKLQTKDKKNLLPGEKACLPALGLFQTLQQVNHLWSLVLLTLPISMFLRCTQVFHPKILIAQDTQVKLGNHECSWAASQFQILSGACIWFFVVFLEAQGGHGIYVQVQKKARMVSTSLLRSLVGRFLLRSLWSQEKIVMMLSHRGTCEGNPFYSKDKIKTKVIQSKGSLQKCIL